MEMIRRITFSVVMAYLLLMLTACGGGRSVEMAALLDRADSLLTVQPDSALRLLDSALYSVNLSRHETALLRLRRLNAINKLDIVFTAAHVEQAKMLAAYFDRHGTPNERMLAHYLLGRTHADMDQALQAVQSYQDAIEAADTTSADCDYKQMGIIYTQMSNVFYYNCLYREQLDCLDKAIYYGSLAKDTLGTLLAYTQKIGGYTLLQNPDSMQYVCNEVSRLFLQAGYPQLSAAVQANPVSYLIETGQIEQAHQHLMAYEHGSGFFDKDNNIQPGREIYYYHKGMYCLATCQYDSAEYYFRKELRLGKDFNNQNSASRGLSLLFQKTHRPDSAAKYALYSYEMNDSMHFHKYAHEISRMRTLYDYSRFQHQAMQEKEKVERFNLYFLVSVFSFVVLVLITFVAGYVLVQKKRRLEERIELLRGYAVNQNLRDSPIAQQFRELLRTNPYHQPELKDWKELSAVIDREAPHFHKTLCQGDVQLSDFEYDVCMLIKIQIPLSDIARLKQCVPSYITQTRKHIFQKLFKKKGRADELDEYIMKLL